MIPFVPGDTMSSVAMRVLGASYGIVLRNPVVDLPDGLTAVYPKMVDNIPAGGETILVARMKRPVDTGDIKLHGKVGGDKYEQTYPISLKTTSAKGNAFVPRLYAATKIADLEANEGDAAKEELVDLSKRFAVASRYTSLLVLESAAMFKAFGIDRNTSSAPLWTGEEESESSGADGLTRYRDAEEGEDSPLALGGGGLGAGFAGGKAKKERAARPTTASPAFDDEMAYAAPPAPKSGPAPSMDALEVNRRRRPPRGGMVPMRRVWDRKSLINADTGPAVEKASKAISEMEREVSDNPDSRTRLEKLLGLYAVTGQLNRASDLAERWAKRDALDPGALVARAEAAARRGERDKAVRILGGLADVRPGDPDVQKWLAGMQQAAGDEYLACSHRIALAGIRTNDAGILSEALRCAQRTQRGLLASTLRSDISDASLKSRVERELAKATDEVKLRGDVRIEATWDDDVDLDVVPDRWQGRALLVAGRSQGSGDGAGRNLHASRDPCGVQRSAWRLSGGSDTG